MKKIQMAMMSCSMYFSGLDFGIGFADILWLLVFSNAVNTWFVDSAFEIFFFFGLMV